MSDFFCACRMFRHQLYEKNSQNKRERRKKCRQKQKQPAKQKEKKIKQTDKIDAFWKMMSD